MKVKFSVHEYWMTCILGWGIFLLSQLTLCLLLLEYMSDFQLSAHTQNKCTLPLLRNCQIKTEILYCLLFSQTAMNISQIQSLYIQLLVLVTHPILSHWSVSTLHRHVLMLNHHHFYLSIYNSLLAIVWISTSLSTRQGPMNIWKQANRQISKSNHG